MMADTPGMSSSRRSHIHSVRAVGYVVDELNTAGTFLNNTCIFHWFTGSVSERKLAIDNGAYFSEPDSSFSVVRAASAVLFIFMGGKPH